MFRWGVILLVVALMAMAWGLGSLSGFMARAVIKVVFLVGLAFFIAGLIGDRDPA